ncbi:chorismate mutase [Leptolyngbya sp. 'hensonii']|uniref:chromophore lyase CpcT/CpeT n=1 Tax=Leptolyngbya sp. 'hensonii' TaxID=1922337 RepID=UPI00094FE99E|nr:chromophore lyase CpcT/CpeT [Leptolyngbya sp. 'hensonii']OLP19601.1 chorismate mutase [Leptolyngbya sp. 'hensonii']
MPQSHGPDKIGYSPELLALARYLAGEFENREQAISEPVWYVHLRLWHRPVPLFLDDSLLLFAEQASLVNLDQPYRQRIIGLRQSESLQIQYYRLKEPAAFQGAGTAPECLQRLTPDQIELLPGCTLNVTWQHLQPSSYRFQAFLTAEARCCFPYQGELRYVSLGFEASPDDFLSYDKGIDPATGKALWGAIMGPFRFIKRQDFSQELPI